MLFAPLALSAALVLATIVIQIVGLVVLIWIMRRRASRFAGFSYVIQQLGVILAVVMGLNLLGLLKIPLPGGPDPEQWRKRVPAPLAPVAAGLAFGVAASPCTTPVLAVLLGWIAQSGRPLVGVAMLSSFGIGQVLPLLLAGTFAASIPKLLALRSISRWVPPVSGVVLLTTGLLTLLARWS